MTLPPLEPRQYFVRDRVQQLLNDDEWFFAVTFAYDNDPHGPARLPEYAKAKATEQAEREWAERMDVLLDAQINQELTR